MPDTIPVGKYYNFDNKNVDVVYNPATDDGKGGSGGGNFVIGLKSVDSETGDIMLDKTAGEIIEAMQTKNVVVIMENDGTGFYFDSIAIAKMLVGGQEFFSFDFGRLMTGQATGIDEYPIVKVDL